MKRLLPLALVLLLAGCAHLHPAGPLTLRPGDSGKTVETTARQIVTLRLPANPSTGYVWQVVAEPDAPVLIITDTGFDEPASAAPGTPGEAWWKLRVTGIGTTAFSLRYVRPWEPDKVAAQFNVTVVVK